MNPDNERRHESHPMVGVLVTDTLSGRCGVVTGALVEYSRWTGNALRCELYLRPERGGLEWSVDESCVERVTATTGTRVPPPAADPLDGHDNEPGRRRHPGGSHARHL